MASFSPYDQPIQRDALVSLRRDLHRHPEIGFQELKTSALIRNRLEATGMEVRGLAGTGLIGTLKGGKPGQTVLIRAELDALPILEESETDYRSQAAGAMDACGDD